MQETEKAAAETKTERSGALRLEGKGGIIDLELTYGQLQSLKVICADGVDATEDKWVNLFKARQRLRRWLPALRDGQIVVVAFGRSDIEKISPAFTGADAFAEDAVHAPVVVVVSHSVGFGLRGMRLSAVLKGKNVLEMSKNS